MSVDSNSGVAALTALEERQPAAPTEELRIAVVLNGGVSLAVWMGGVSHELNRLSFADDPGRASPYAPLLELTRSTVRIDVIAGSSAGGINGAMLALAESNRSARLSSLRELWSDQGRIESLLRRPFAGQPASLLLGDEYFLPELGRAMTAMNEDFQPTQRRIDLTVTTTLLRGVPEKTIDALGQVIPDEVHSGRFRSVPVRTSSIPAKMISVRVDSPRRPRRSRSPRDAQRVFPARSSRRSFRSTARRPGAPPRPSNARTSDATRAGGTQRTKGGPTAPVSWWMAAYWSIRRPGPLSRPLTPCLSSSPPGECCCSCTRTPRLLGQTVRTCWASRPCSPKGLPGCWAR